MSRQDAQSFLERVERDRALRQAATTTGDEDCAAFFEHLIALGAKHGLRFTTGDLQQVWEERRRAAGNGELGDADLRGVAGGTGVRSQVEAKLDQVRKDLVRNWAG